MTMTKAEAQEIMSHVDHTLLSPTATSDDIKRTVEEAVRCGCAAACVAPVNVPVAVKRAGELGGLDIASVVGFPHGNSTPKTKVNEALEAVESGAAEIDMVINLGPVKEADWDFVLNEVRMMKWALGESAILKVIIETCLLTDDEIAKLCEICLRAGADYIKTSTGYSTGGATVADVELMKSNSGDMKVKASGGIRTLDDAKAMIDAGADRIGASKLVAEFEAIQ